MKRGSILIAVLLLLCILVLLFFLISSSSSRNYGLAKSRTVAEKSFYKNESIIHDLDTDMVKKEQLKKIIAQNMQVYSGLFQRMKLYDKPGFSDDWIFFLYPDSNASGIRHLLEIQYHDKSNGIHSQVSGTFSFHDSTFFSSKGYFDSENIPKGYDSIQTFIEECSKEWIDYSAAISPKKIVKDFREASQIRIFQKPGRGYNICKYMGDDGKHSCGMDEFDFRSSVNLAGADSEFTTHETKTDVYLEGVANGFPRKDPTILFGTYVIDGDLYVNTTSSIYGILILKGGKIFCSDGAKLNVHGLVLSELPLNDVVKCNIEFDAKYMLREAVVLPNFLDVQLIGIRE